MKTSSLLKIGLAALVVVLALLGVARWGLSPPKTAPGGASSRDAATRDAEAQIARLRACRLSHPDAYGNELMTITDGAHFPFKALYDMGLPALPALADALDDTTPTDVVERNDQMIMTASPSNMPPPRPLTVRELAATLIVSIAEHDFVAGQYPRQFVLSTDIDKGAELVPQFQAAVREWYAHNRGRTLTQRRIADVDDPWFRNRLNAVAWLGKRKVRQAEPAIAAYIRRSLTTPVPDSLIDVEVAESTLALGQIGDRHRLPLVRQVCRFLASDFKQYLTRTLDLYTLFQAYQGQALLGQKAQTRQQLQSLYAQCAARMTPRTQREFQERLQKSARW